MHNASSLLGPSLALATLALPSIALQIPPATATVDGEGLGFAWDSSVGAGPFRNVAVGHFTDTERLDVAVIRGSKVHLASQPGAYASLAESELFAKDVATIPAPAGALDRLAVVGGNGLKIADYVAGKHCLNGADFCPDLTTVDTSAWVDATDLLCEQIDGTHGHDLAAISADGSTILIALDNGSGGFTLSSFSAPSTASALAAGQWIGGGDSELVIATSTGLHACDRFGTPLYNEFNLSTDDQLVTLPNHVLDPSGNPIADAFAWLTWDPSNNHILVVAGKGITEVPIDVTSKGIVRMAGTESEVDRDLICSSNNSFQVHVFENGGGNSNSDPLYSSFAGAALATGVEYSNSPASPSTIKAEPAGADFDNDGTPEIFLAVKPLEHIVYFEQAPTNVVHYNGNYGLVEIDCCHRFVYDETNTANGEGTLEVAVDYPLDLPSLLPTTHLEVVVWEIASGSATTTGAGKTHCLLPVGTGCLTTIDTTSINDCYDGSNAPLTGHERVFLPVFMDPTTWPSSGAPSTISESFIVEWRPVHAPGGAVADSGRSEFIRWEPTNSAAARATWLDTTTWTDGVDAGLESYETTSDSSLCPFAGDPGIAPGTVVPESRTHHPPLPRPGQSCKSAKTGAAGTTSASGTVCTNN